MYQIPILNPTIDIQPIDTSSRRNKFIIRVDSKSQYEISETIYRTITLIDGHRTYVEIASELSYKTGKNFYPFQIQHIINDFLIPSGIVIGTNFNKSKKNNSFLYMKVPVFSDQMILPVTNHLQALFLKPIALTLVIILFIFYIYTILKTKQTDLLLELLQRSNNL